MNPSIDQVNSHVKAAVHGQLGSSFPGRVRGVDCGHLFRLRPRDVHDGAEVDEKLMPDALHPNLEGSRLLSECAREALGRWRRETVSGLDVSDGKAPLTDPVF